MLYHVRYNGVGKTYMFKSKLNLKVGETYDIVADDITRYSSPVLIVAAEIDQPTSIQVRTITAADCLSEKKYVVKASHDRIKNIYFNLENSVTTVIWYDGVITTVKCHEDDEFDAEKAIAMCYMKRMLGNSGAFNEVFKKHIVVDNFCAHSNRTKKKHRD